MRSAIGPPNATGPRNSAPPPYSVVLVMSRPGWPRPFMLAQPSQSVWNASTTPGSPVNVTPAPARLGAVARVSTVSLRNAVRRPPNRPDTPIAMNDVGCHMMPPLAPTPEYERRDVWENVWTVVSTDVRRIVRLLSPEYTSADTPSHNVCSTATAMPGLMSSIAPDTLKFSVNCTLSLAKWSKPVRVVSHVRSSSVDTEMPAVTRLPMLIAPLMIGNRLVVVWSDWPLVVTWRNSGAYSTYTPGRIHAAIEAGLSADCASVSAGPPPNAAAAALIWPGGYPKPCVLTVPCARAVPAAASAAARSAGGMNRVRITEGRTRSGECS